MKTGLRYILPCHPAVAARHGYKNYSAFFRGIAAVVLVSFIVTSTGWTLPSKIANVAVEAKTPPVSSALDVIAASLSPREGTIKEQFSGTSEKLVVHIQDAHCNVEAQTNSGKIIKDLIYNKALAFDLIGMEGASGDLDTSELTAIPDVNVKKRVALHLLHKGVLSGPEYLSIMNDFPLPLYGVEDFSLYFSHLDVFQKNYESQEAVTVFFNQADVLLEKLQVRVFNPGLAGLYGLVKKYESDKISFTDYLQELRELSSEKTFDLRKFKNVSLFFDVRKYEKNLSVDTVEKERLAIIEVLSEQLPKKKVSELLTKSLYSRLEKIELLEYFAYLEEMLQTIGIDAGNYPAFSRYIDFLRLVEKLDKSAVFMEVEEIVEELKKTMTTTEAERKLDGIYRDITILKGLLFTQLSRDDHAYFTIHENRVSAQTISNGLNELASKYGVPDSVASATSIDRLLPEAKKYYTLAVKRDKAMVKNLLEKLEGEGGKTAVIVAGGFHSSGIAELLREKNISYMVVAPKITQFAVKTPYESIMLDKRSALDSLVKSAETLYAHRMNNPSETVLGKQAAQVETRFDMARSLDEDLGIMSLHQSPEILENALNIGPAGTGPIVERKLDSTRIFHDEKVLLGDIALLLEKDSKEELSRFENMLLENFRRYREQQGLSSEKIEREVADLKKRRAEVFFTPQPQILRSVDGKEYVYISGMIRGMYFGVKVPREIWEKKEEVLASAQYLSGKEFAVDRFFAKVTAGEAEQKCYSAYRELISRLGLDEEREALNLIWQIQIVAGEARIDVSESVLAKIVEDILLDRDLIEASSNSKKKGDGYINRGDKSSDRFFALYWAGTLGEEKSDEFPDTFYGYEVVVFDAVVESRDDYVLGYRDEDARKIFVAREVLETIRNRCGDDNEKYERLINDYLFHEAICDKNEQWGHYEAIIEQQFEYPENYGGEGNLPSGPGWVLVTDIEIGGISVSYRAMVDPNNSEKPLMDPVHNLPRPYKGELGSVLRETINNLAPSPTYIPVRQEKVVGSTVSASEKAAAEKKKDKKDKTGKKTVLQMSLGKGKEAFQNFFNGISWKSIFRKLAVSSVKLAFSVGLAGVLLFGIDLHLPVLEAGESMITGITEGLWNLLAVFGLFLSFFAGAWTAVRINPSKKPGTMNSLKKLGAYIGIPAVYGILLFGGICSGFEPLAQLVLLLLTGGLAVYFAGGAIDLVIKTVELVGQYIRITPSESRFLAQIEFNHSLYTFFNRMIILGLNIIYGFLTFNIAASDPIISMLAIISFTYLNGAIAMLLTTSLVWLFVPRKDPDEHPWIVKNGVIPLRMHTALHVPFLSKKRGQSANAVNRAIKSFERNVSMIEVEKDSDGNILIQYKNRDPKTVPLSYFDDLLAKRLDEELVAGSGKHLSVPDPRDHLKIVLQSQAPTAEAAAREIELAKRFHEKYGRDRFVWTHRLMVQPHGLKWGTYQDGHEVMQKKVKHPIRYVGDEQDMRDTFSVTRPDGSAIDIHRIDDENNYGFHERRTLTVDKEMLSEDVKFNHYQIREALDGRRLRVYLGELYTMKDDGSLGERIADSDQWHWDHHGHIVDENHNPILVDGKEFGEAREINYQTYTFTVTEKAAGLHPLLKEKAGKTITLTANDEGDLLTTADTGDFILDTGRIFSRRGEHRLWFAKDLYDRTGKLIAENVDFSRPSFTVKRTSTGKLKMIVTNWMGPNDNYKVAVDKEVMSEGDLVSLKLDNDGKPVGAGVIMAEGAEAKKGKYKLDTKKNVLTVQTDFGGRSFTLKKNKHGYYDAYKLDEKGEPKKEYSNLAVAEKKYIEVQIKAASEKATVLDHKGQLWYKGRIESKEPRASYYKGFSLVNKEGDLITLEDGTYMRGEYFGMDLRRWDPLQRYWGVQDKFLTDAIEQNILTKEEAEQVAFTGTYGSEYSLHEGKTGNETTWYIKEKDLSEYLSGIEEKRKVAEGCLVNSRDEFFVVSEKGLSKENRKHKGIIPDSELSPGDLARETVWHGKDGLWYRVWTLAAKKGTFEELRSVPDKTSKIPYLYYQDGTEVLDLAKDRAEPDHCLEILCQTDEDNEFLKGSVKKAAAIAANWHLLEDRHPYAIIQGAIDFTNRGQSKFATLGVIAQRLMFFTQEALNVVYKGSSFYGKGVQLVNRYIREIRDKEAIKANAKSHDHYEAKKGRAILVTAIKISEDAQAWFTGMLVQIARWIAGDWVFHYLETKNFRIAMQAIRGFWMKGYFGKALKTVLTPMHEGPLPGMIAMANMRGLLSESVFIIWLVLGVTATFVPGIREVVMPELSLYLFAIVMFFLVVVPKLLRPILSDLLGFPDEKLWRRVSGFFDRINILAQADTLLDKRYEKRRMRESGTSRAGVSLHYSLAKFFSGMGAVAAAVIFKPLAMVSYIVLVSARGIPRILLTVVPVAAIVYPVWEVVMPWWNGVTFSLFLFLERLFPVLSRWIIESGSGYLSTGLLGSFIEVLPIIAGGVIGLSMTPPGARILGHFWGFIDETFHSTSILILGLIFRPITIYKVFVEQLTGKSGVWTPQAVVDEIREQGMSWKDTYRALWLAPVAGVILSLLTLLGFLNPAILLVGYPIFILSWIFGPYFAWRTAFYGIDRDWSAPNLFECMRQMEKDFFTEPVLFDKSKIEEFYAKLDTAMKSEQIDASCAENNLKMKQQLDEYFNDKKDRPTLRRTREKIFGIINTIELPDPIKEMLLNYSWSILRGYIQELADDQELEVWQRMRLFQYYGYLEAKYLLIKRLTGPDTEKRIVVTDLYEKINDIIDERSLPKEFIEKLYNDFAVFAEENDIVITGWQLKRMIPILGVFRDLLDFWKHRSAWYRIEESSRNHRINAFIQRFLYSGFTKFWEKAVNEKAYLRVNALNRSGLDSKEDRQLMLDIGILTEFDIAMYKARKASQAIKGKALRHELLSIAGKYRLDLRQRVTMLYTITAKKHNHFEKIEALWFAASAANEKIRKQVADFNSNKDSFEESFLKVKKTIEDFFEENNVKKEITVLLGDPGKIAQAYFPPEFSEDEEKKAEPQEQEVHYPEEKPIETPQADEIAVPSEAVEERVTAEETMHEQGQQEKLPVIPEAQTEEPLSEEQKLGEEQAEYIQALLQKITQTDEDYMFWRLARRTINEILKDDDDMDIDAFSKAIDVLMDSLLAIAVKRKQQRKLYVFARNIIYAAAKHIDRHLVLRLGPKKLREHIKNLLGSKGILPIGKKLSAFDPAGRFDVFLQQVADGKKQARMVRKRLSDDGLDNVLFMLLSKNAAPVAGDIFTPVERTLLRRLNQTSIDLDALQEMWQRHVSEYQSAFQDGVQTVTKENLNTFIDQVIARFPEIELLVSENRNSQIDGFVAQDADGATMKEFLSRYADEETWQEHFGAVQEPGLQQEFSEECDGYEIFLFNAIVHDEDSFILAYRDDDKKRILLSTEVFQAIQSLPDKEQQRLLLAELIAHERGCGKDASHLGMIANQQKRFAGNYENAGFKQTSMSIDGINTEVLVDPAVIDERTGRPKLAKGLLGEKLRFVIDSVVRLNEPCEDLFADMELFRLVYGEPKITVRAVPEYLEQVLDEDELEKKEASLDTLEKKLEDDEVLNGWIQKMGLKPFLDMYSMLEQAFDEDDARYFLYKAFHAGYSDKENTVIKAVAELFTVTNVTADEHLEDMEQLADLFDRDDLQDYWPGIVRLTEALYDIGSWEFHFTTLPFFLEEYSPDEFNELVTVLIDSGYISSSQFGGLQEVLDGYGIFRESNSSETGTLAEFLLELSTLLEYAREVSTELFSEGNGEMKKAIAKILDRTADRQGTLKVLEELFEQCRDLNENSLDTLISMLSTISIRTTPNRITDEIQRVFSYLGDDTDDDSEYFTVTGPDAGKLTSSEKTGSSFGQETGTYIEHERKFYLEGIDREVFVSIRRAFIDAYDKNNLVAGIELNRERTRKGSGGRSVVLEIGEDDELGKRRPYIFMDSYGLLARQGIRLSIRDRGKDYQVTAKIPVRLINSDDTTDAQIEVNATIARKGDGVAGLRLVTPQEALAALEQQGELKEKTLPEGMRAENVSMKQLLPYLKPVESLPMAEAECLSYDVNTNHIHVLSENGPVDIALDRVVVDTGEKTSEFFELELEAELKNASSEEKERAIDAVRTKLGPWLETEFNVRLVSQPKGMNKFTRAVRERERLQAIAVDDRQEISVVSLDQLKQRFRTTFAAQSRQGLLNMLVARVTAQSEADIFSPTNESLTDSVIAAVETAAQDTRALYELRRNVDSIVAAREEQVRSMDLDVNQAGVTDMKIGALTALLQMAGFLRGKVLPALVLEQFVSAYINGEEFRYEGVVIEAAQMRDMVMNDIVARLGTLRGDGAPSAGRISDEQGLTSGLVLELAEMSKYGRLVDAYVAAEAEEKQAIIAELSTYAMGLAPGTLKTMIERSTAKVISLAENGQLTIQGQTVVVPDSISEGLRKLFRENGVRLIDFGLTWYVSPKRYTAVLEALALQTESSLQKGITGFDDNSLIMPKIENGVLSFEVLSQADRYNNYFTDKRSAEYADRFETPKGIVLEGGAAGLRVFRDQAGAVRIERKGFNFHEFFASIQALNEQSREKGKEQVTVGVPVIVEESVSKDIPAAEQDALLRQVEAQVLQDLLATKEVPENLVIKAYAHDAKNIDADIADKLGFSLQIGVKNTNLSFIVSAKSQDYFPNIGQYLQWIVAEELPADKLVIIVDELANNGVIDKNSDLYQFIKEADPDVLDALNRRRLPDPQTTFEEIEMRIKSERGTATMA